MHDANDMDLLRQFAAENSQSAFATLVGRHVNLVYSTALRRAGSPHAAEEITQAVFIILAEKAGRISRQTILPGWLYQTARLTAASFRRREIRRTRREQEAYMQSQSDQAHSGAADETWRQLAPLLEDAMGHLGETDRAAVVLRFFNGQSFAEVGTAFGLTENAAKKRVNRALEKLHRYFQRRGLSSTTVIIAGIMATHSVHAAPVSLAQTISAVAVVKGVTATTSTLSLVKGVLKIMAWSKAKLAITVAISAVLVAGTAGIAITNRSDDESLDAKIIRLSRPGTTARQAISVLGEPGKYGPGIASFDKHHLPATYWMVYTNAVNVLVTRGKVTQIASLKPGPGFSFHGKLRLGSTLEEVMAEVGPPLETIVPRPDQDIPGKTLGGYAGVLYTDIGGIKGACYYWRPDQNVRFIFRDNKVIAILIDVLG